MGMKPRTGPLQTNKLMTAPTTTHQGLVISAPAPSLPCAAPDQTRSVAAISRAGQRYRESARPLAQDRALAPDALLVWFELPAGEFVAL